MGFGRKNIYNSLDPLKKLNRLSKVSYRSNFTNPLIKSISLQAFFCFLMLLYILLNSHIAIFQAIGTILIIEWLFIQFRTNTILVENESTSIATKHLAGKVAHLAMVIVLIKNLVC
jgi:hypothetical protein